MTQTVANRAVLASRTFLLNRGIGRKDLFLLAPRDGDADRRYAVACLPGDWNGADNSERFHDLAAAQARFADRAVRMARLYPR